MEIKNYKILLKEAINIKTNSFIKNLEEIGLKNNLTIKIEHEINNLNGYSILNLSINEIEISDKPLDIWNFERISKLQQKEKEFILYASRELYFLNIELKDIKF